MCCFVMWCHWEGLTWPKSSFLPHSAPADNVPSALNPSDQETRPNPCLSMGGMELLR